MKPWIKRTLIGLASATVLFGGLTACGHRASHGSWSDERVAEVRGKAIERISSKLELNAEQQQKLGVVADELIAQRKAIRGEGTGPGAEFKALIAGEKFDRSAAQKLLESKTAAVQGQGPKVLDALANFYDSLTPAQQQQVRERMEQGRHRGWWGRG